MDKRFVKRDFGNFHIVVTTKEEKFDLDINGENFKDNMEIIKDKFNISNIAYNFQNHSDIVNIKDSSNICDIAKGDSIISQGIAVGVFTADCVPVLLWDHKKKVLAAVHSGWKGTLSNIVGKTVEKLKMEFNCDERDLNAFIAPHIKSCCYEVSEELIGKFKEIEIFKDKNINSGRYLNLTECIRVELLQSAIKEENIFYEEACTHCSKGIKLHSYRKDKENSGRNFSFIYFKS